MTASGQIAQSEEFGAAEWVAQRLAPFDAWTVGSIVPTGFEAYVRLLHPISWVEPVRWSDLAARSGRVMHAQVEFDQLDPPDDSEEPDTGLLSPKLTEALTEVLAAHTATPGQCWFCLWDGWGWLHGPPGVNIAVSASAAERAQVTGEMERRWEPPARLDSGRVRLPGRNYLLFNGPLAAVSDFGYWTEFPDGRRFFDHWSPNLWWPDDRSWCVATEIDLDSTYVGGGPALIRALLEDDRFEAWPVNADDVRGDTINPPATR